MRNSSGSADALRTGQTLWLAGDFAQD